VRPGRNVSDDSLERLVRLGAHLHRLSKGRRADRYNQKVLHGQLFAGAGAAASTDTMVSGNSVAPASAETPSSSAAADEGVGSSESATAALAAGGDDSGTAVGAAKLPHEYRHLNRTKTWP